MSESKLCYYQWSVGQPVLVPSPHLGPKTTFLLLSDSCGFVDVRLPLRLEDGSVSLQFQLTLASAVFLGTKSCGTHAYILLSKIRHFPNLEGQVTIFISLRNGGGPVIPPGTGFPFRHPLRLAGIQWKYLNPPPHGDFVNGYWSLLYIYIHSYSLGTDCTENTASSNSSIVACMSVATIA
jgi:hypothetical protein